MIFAPDFPSASFDPVHSRCQCVLNSTRTWLVLVCSATVFSNSADCSASPPSTINNPSGPLTTTTFDPAPVISKMLPASRVAAIPLSANNDVDNPAEHTLRKSRRLDLELTRNILLCACVRLKG